MPAQSDLNKFYALIKDIKFAMLTTVEADGSLRSRPMSTQKPEADGELWFVTNTDSSKVEEVEQDRHVNVSFVLPEQNRFISVSGVASLEDNKNKVDELWDPAFQAWFKQGKDSPHLGLLHVRITHAEYWDPASGRMVELPGLTRSFVAGKSVRPGEAHQLSFDEDAGRTSAHYHDKKKPHADPQTHILSPIDESPD